MHAQHKIRAIESLRIIASFFVVLLHYFPFEGTIKLVIDETARFAVPFFFVSSGYFVGKKLQANEGFSGANKTLKRLLILFVCWQMIYFLNPIRNDIHEFGVVEAYTQKFEHVFYGSIEDKLFDAFGFHLWFLSSLFFSLLIVVMVKPRYFKLLFIFAILSYIIGVMTKSYTNTPIGITLNFNTRNFVFFSMLPVCLGVYSGFHQLKLSLSQSVMITMIGFFGHYAEAYFLRTYYQTDIMDYGFTTFLMGYGLFSIALNEPAVLQHRYLVGAGQYSLGIYCIHVLVGSRLIEDLNYDFSSSLNCVALPILVFIISFVLVYFLKKVKLLNAYLV
jgi:surface polysaccharide O-acyltransferase-like enzyme